MFLLYFLKFIVTSKVSNGLMDLPAIQKLTTSTKQSDKEILQVIKHYKKVIASQRNEIAILSHQLRKLNKF